MLNLFDLVEDRPFPSAIVPKILNLISNYPETPYSGSGRQLSTLYIDERDMDGMSKPQFLTRVNKARVVVQIDMPLALSCAADVGSEQRPLRPMIYYELYAQF